MTYPLVTALRGCLLGRSIFGKIELGQEILVEFRGFFSLVVSTRESGGTTVMDNESQERANQTE